MNSQLNIPNETTKNYLAPWAVGTKRFLRLLRKILKYLK